MYFVSYSVAVDEKVLLECIKFMETLLDKVAGRLALDQFFNQENGRDLVTVLLSVATPQGSLSTQYSTKVLHFFNKLFSTGKKLVWLSRYYISHVKDVFFVIIIINKARPLNC